MIFPDADGKYKHLSEIRANLYEIRFPGSRKAFIAGWVECLDRINDTIELMLRDMDPEAEDFNADDAPDEE